MPLVLFGVTRDFLYLVQFPFHSLANSKKGPGIDLINKQCDISFLALRIIAQTTEFAWVFPFFCIVFVFTVTVVIYIFLCVEKSVSKKV